MMEWSAIIMIIIYSMVLVSVILLIAILASGKSAKTMRKAPARYVSISSTDDVDSYMDVYELDWKPGRDERQELPKEIREVLGNTETISPLVTELSSRINDPDINPNDISKLIITDQGLTSFILKRVNSPFYGLLQKVDNIFNAIVILGYNEIYRIVMEERTSKIGLKPSRAEWIHSNLTATIGSYLATTSRIGVSGGTMVTLGMLHDIAKIIMEQSLPQPESGFSLDPRQRLRQETELYGIDHATLGGLLARQWRMPERLSKAIERHHWPMFWPLRDIAQESSDVIKELAILSISDVAARNFMQQLDGIYIGNDYYRYINKPARMDSILHSEIIRDLKRIRLLGEVEETDALVQ